MHGIVMMPFASPDKAVGLKNTDNAGQYVVGQQRRRVGTFGVGPATVPTPVPAQIIGQPEIDCCRQGMHTLPRSAGNVAPVKGPCRRGHIGHQHGIGRDLIAHGPERCGCPI